MKPAGKPSENNNRNDRRDFLDQLEDEHRKILEILREVKTQGVHTMDGRNALTAAKDLMCMHFKKEDEILYPALKEAIKKNPEKQNIIETLIEDMKEVTDFCQSFFEKYAIGGGGIEFLRDFEKLYMMLESRLKKEETILYPNYFSD
jgi:iron-sulfur cluster repair protein YtfE (RIC family)